MNHRPGIKDVASLAGVSIKTVSRVVNGINTVDPQMRDRVEAAISHLHYVPNSIARALKTGEADAVGIIVDSLDDVFFSSLISAIEEQALARGLGVVICSTGHDAERERDQVLRLAGQHVRGIILTPVADVRAQLTPYRASMPVVTIDRTLPGYDSVVVDDYSAARQATQALLAAGHRRIALIGWNAGFQTAQRRRDAYVDVLTDNGIDVDEALIPQIDFRAGAATTALLAVLADPDPPTAMFITNARHAATVVALTHRLGRTDLAMISFGDFLLADSLTPSITCIDQDPYAIGAAAFERLLELMDDPQSPPSQQVLPTDFIDRASHALSPIPAGAASA